MTSTEPSPPADALWPATARTPAVRSGRRPEILLVCPSDSVGDDVAAALGATMGVFGPLELPRCDPAIKEAAHFDAAIVDVDQGDAAYDLVWNLSQASTPCRSVIVGSRIDRACLRDALHIGVVAVLKKPTEPRMLELAVRRAVEATWMMRASIRAFDADPTVERPAAEVDLSPLTAREREVLALLLEGRTTRMIAEIVGCSQRTIKFHASNVLHKLGVGSRLSLLAKLRGGPGW